MGETSGEEQLRNDAKSRILCIGAGHVGGPSMAVIAHNCPHCQVVVVDIDEKRIEAWNSSKLPVYEPGLKEVVTETRGRNLFFSTDISENIDRADIIFVSVNTPLKTYGHGAGIAPDLRYWESTARQIVQASKDSKIVVEKSTVPVWTAAAMERILNANSRGIRFVVLSNPEFLAEGSAIGDMQKPDRVLIGGRDSASGAEAVERLVELYEHWVPRERIITTNLWSSELSKLAANAFLAQRVSSINSISALCEKTGADVTEVARAIGLDHRIGSEFLRASIGFGGSCFKKDILNLVYLCENEGLPGVATYWRQVVEMNELQQKRFFTRILSAMFNTLGGKRIAVFGASFKAHTADVRESPGLTLSRRLLEEKAQVVITDPRALDNARQALVEVGNEVVFEEDPYAAARGAHAIVLVTDWPSFGALDYQAIYSGMEKPAFVFDGRNMLYHDRLRQIGFEVYAVGKPARTTLNPDFQ